MSSTAPENYEVDSFGRQVKPRENFDGQRDTNRGSAVDDRRPVVSGTVGERERDNYPRERERNFQRFPDDYDDRNIPHGGGNVNNRIPKLRKRPYEDVPFNAPPVQDTFSPPISTSYHQSGGYEIDSYPQDLNRRLTPRERGGGVAERGPRHSYDGPETVGMAGGRGSGRGGGGGGRFSSRMFQQQGDRDRENRDYRRDSRDRDSRDWDRDRYGNSGVMQSAASNNLPLDSRAPHLSTPLIPEAPTRLPVHRVIPPLVTFKTFMQFESDDLSPEAFQKKYDEYNLKYVKDFCEAFFQVSKNELWFQDRYNPLRYQELEQEGAQWAQIESMKFKTDLEAYPVEIIKNVCLDKSANFTTVNRKEIPISALKTKTEIEVEDMLPAGKHFSGHEHRTLFMSGIHSSCTLPMLKTAVAEALAAIPCVLPDRVVMAQPMWTKAVPSRFERKAWMIMPSLEAAQIALKALQDKGITVNVNGPIDQSTGEVSHILFQFKAQIAPHLIRQSPSHGILPDHLSMPHRIAVDTYKATELAELLDTDKNLSDESKLSTTLKLPLIQQACTKLTDKLDIAIAYLRRVHFVTFYGGRIYQDEAHLLTMSPSCMYRNKTCTTVAPPHPPTAIKNSYNANTQNGNNKSRSGSVVNTTDSSNNTDIVVTATNITTSSTGNEINSNEHKISDDKDESATAVADNDDTIGNANDDGDNVDDDNDDNHDNREKYEQNVDVDYVEREDENEGDKVATSTTDIIEAALTVTGDTTAPAITSAVASSEIVSTDDTTVAATSDPAVGDDSDIKALETVDMNTETSITEETKSVVEGETIIDTVKKSEEDADMVVPSAIVTDESTVNIPPTITTTTAVIKTEEDGEQQEGKDTTATTDVITETTTTTAPSADVIVDAEVEKERIKEIQAVLFEKPTDFVKKGHSDKHVEAIIKGLIRKISRKKEQQQYLLLLQQRQAEITAATAAATSIAATATDTSVSDNSTGTSTAVVISPPPLPIKVLGTKDEEDAKLLRELNDKALTECVEIKCKKEKDEKVRCWFPFCLKLFKNLDFLKKHVTLKHDYYATEIMVRNAEPFMRTRYEQEDISLRPLPPLEYEMTGGLIERKSVSEILNKYSIPKFTPVPPPPPAYFHGSDRGSSGGGRYNDDYNRSGSNNDFQRRNSGGGNSNFNRRQVGSGSNTDNNRSSYQQKGDRDNFGRDRDNNNNNRFDNQRGGNDRGSGENIRRNSFSSTAAAGGVQVSSAVPVVVTTAPVVVEDTYKRKLSTYMDVDAPKEMVKEIDYGVAILPPAKKRKSLTAATAAAVKK